MLDTITISPDFPYESRYIEVLGSKMHYIEEGSGDPILFLHGNPTSSYLWRNIIPHLSSLGRCIALDLIGMGKSDNPDIDYRFFDHARYLEGFIEQMGLENITLVIHDWGSALGFHYASRHEDNIKGIAFMEAIVAPIPSWDVIPDEDQELFRAFRTPGLGWDMLVNQNMFIEQLLPNLVVRDLSESEMQHYRAPYKDPTKRKAVWRWPNEISIGGLPVDMTKLICDYNHWLQETNLPKLLLYADGGIVLPMGLVAWCEETLPNLKSVNIGLGLHYFQEDSPYEIGTELAAWYKGVSNEC